MKRSIFLLALCVATANAMEIDNALSGHMKKLQVSDTPIGDTPQPQELCEVSEYSFTGDDDGYFSPNEDNSLIGHMEKLQLSDPPSGDTPMPQKLVKRIKKKIKKKKTVPLGAIEEDIIKNLCLKRIESAKAIEIIAPSLAPKQHKELRQRARNKLIRSFDKQFNRRLENYVSDNITYSFSCVEYREKNPEHRPFNHACPKCKKWMMCHNKGHECLAGKEREYISCTSMQVPRNFSYVAVFFSAKKHFEINNNALRQNFLLLQTIASIDVERAKMVVSYFKSHPKDLKVNEFDRVEKHLENKCLQKENYLENLALLAELRQLLAVVKEKQSEITPE